MNKKRSFEVQTNEKNIRLDLFLTFRNNDLTRSYIKQLIIKGNIYLNGMKGASAAYKVKPGDLIALILDEPVDTSVIAENIPLDVIFEDEDYLVINKPYGMVVHPASGNWSGTLANAVLHRNQLNEIGDRSRPGIVHRLDKDTSGVIIIAKNNETLWWLTRQFAERRVEKQYVCFGVGSMDLGKLSKQKFANINISIDNGSIDVESGLKRSKLNRKLISVDEEGKISKTTFKPLLEKDFYIGKDKFTFTLCEAKPHTGRTHQIRVHMKALGFPIWGDTFYMGRKQINSVYEISKEYKLSNRLFLHAQKITFFDKLGKKRSFEAELPPELKEIIR